MSENKLTILSMTYNHERFIEQTLQGFVEQKTKYPFEVIISDDCSTDGTAGIISDYANRYPNIIKPIFREKNLGAGENYKATQALANTEYVLYCEGDDYFNDPLKIEKQIDFLEENPEFTICFHPTNFICENIGKPPQYFPVDPKRKVNEDLFTFDNLLYHNFTETCSVMYRWLFRDGKTINDALPKNIMPGDWFRHLLHAREGKIGYINDAMSTYRRHPGGIWFDAAQNNWDMFFIKYGEYHVNFFVQVAKTFLNNNNIEQYRKKMVLPLAFNVLISFLKHKRTDKIQRFIEICPEEYEFAVELIRLMSTMPA